MYKTAADPVHFTTLLQAAEWKRPFGRASKTVCLKASFIPFDADMVATGAQLRRLIGVPVLHTFWMECADLDSYKVSSYTDIYIKVSQGISVKGIHNRYFEVSRFLNV